MISSAGAAWCAAAGVCKRAAAGVWRLAYCAATARAAGASGWFDWLARAAAGHGCEPSCGFVRVKCWTETSNDLILLRRSQKSAKNRRGLVY